ncbi:DUF4214 domain-containing protein [Methylobacterium planeticum]
MARLYEGLLDRAPDLQGLVYWATAAQNGACCGNRTSLPLLS